MAELTDDPAPAPCCGASAQASCCERSEKADCCSPAASTCGCAAWAPADTDIRERVRERYAAAAAALGPDGCAPTALSADASGAPVFGGALYGEDDHGAPAQALAASLGCGVPTAVADLHEGETVLDLGSGAGADVLIAARRVGPTGRAIGVDMSEEMLALARANAAAAGVHNVELLRGYLEELPLPDASVDVVISNCVSTSPPTRRSCCARPRASCARAGASRSPT
jgi:SAM-dependent methyltransferase